MVYLPHQYIAQNIQEAMILKEIPLLTECMF